jgi:peptidoglycan/xylan/chitin deacetylase (PgdA/CDA1 family)
MNALVPAFRHLSPAGAKGRLSILAFHRVLRESDSLFADVPDARRFAQILTWLKGWFNVLPLDDAVQRLSRGALPERAAAITFDDGYADNVTVALPVLREHGMPATFFVATGFLDGGRMWNDTIIEAIRRSTLDAIDLSAIGLPTLSIASHAERRAAIEQCIRALKYRPLAQRVADAEQVALAARATPPDDLMMTSAQVRELHRNRMQVGAHTVSHPILTRLRPEDARREIAASRERLQNLLDAPVTSFAYPNGKAGDDYSDEHVALVRELGFAYSVSTNPGAASSTSDLMQLPRFTPWDRTSFRFGARMLANLASARRASRGDSKERERIPL